MSIVPRPLWLAEIENENGKRQGQVLLFIQRERVFAMVMALS